MKKGGINNKKWKRSKCSGGSNGSSGDRDYNSFSK